MTRVAQYANRLRYVDADEDSAAEAAKKGVPPFKIQLSSAGLPILPKAIDGKPILLVKQRQQCLKAYLQEEYCMTLLYVVLSRSHCCL